MVYKVTNSIIEWFYIAQVTGRDNQTYIFVNQKKEAEKHTLYNTDNLWLNCILSMEQLIQVY